jgi:tetratricopeptide (TPR) repeat protein
MRHSRFKFTIRRAMEAVAVVAVAGGSVASFCYSSSSFRGALARDGSRGIVAERPVSEVLRDAASAIIPRGDDVAVVRALTEIARAQARAGDTEGAVTTSRRASKAAAALRKISERFYALIEVGRVRAESGDRAGGRDDIQRARAAVDEVVDLGDRLGVWREVASAQARSGDRQSADATIRDMRQAILEAPAAAGRFGSLGEVVAAEAEVGDFDGAFRTVEAADKVGLQKGALLGLIAQKVAASVQGAPHAGEAIGQAQRQAARRALDRVAKEADSIVREDNKPVVPLALAMAELGEFEEALRITHRFFKSTGGRFTQVDSTPQAFVLSRIASAQGKAGRLDDARETFREALEKGLVLAASSPAYALDEIALDQIVAGDIPGALKTLDTGPIRQRTNVLTALAKAQASVGDADGARASYRRAILDLYRLRLELPPPPTPPVGHTPVIDNSHHRRGNNLLARLAAIQALSGDVKTALRTLDTIDGDETKAVAVSEIARARASTGDADGALSWAVTLSPRLVRIAALQGLATGISDRGKDPRRN